MKNLMQQHNDQVTSQDSGQTAFVDGQQGTEVACFFRGRRPLRRAGVGLYRLISLPVRLVRGC